MVAITDHKGFADAMRDCEVLWHVLEPITAAHMNAAPKLRLIQKIGVGVNTIDLEAARANGIAVCNMPGTNTRAVAEMTLMLMLSALRRGAMLDRATRRGEGWSLDAAIQDDLGEIAGKTIGLVGFGGVPRLLAPILRAMDAQVIYTATAPKADCADDFRCLPELLGEADILSLHVPLTPETERMIDRAAIDAMKPGAILVNTARGGLVDQTALVAALKSGKIRAAGLDVFDPEPVPADDPILALDNVSLTPHLAWLTAETLERSIEIALENCRRLDDGRDLLHRVV